MTESILAFLALMLVMLFSLNQQRGIVDTNREMASIEVEVMAHAVASETMQFIAQKKYDQNMGDAPGQVNLQNQDLNALTPTDEFPTGQKLDNCPALECFHQMQPDTTFFAVAEDTLGNPVGFDFAITAEVSYIDTAGNATDARTWVKEVTLYVDQISENENQRYLLQPIEKKRRFSPSWE